MDKEMKEWFAFVPAHAIRKYGECEACGDDADNLYQFIGDFHAPYACDGCVNAYLQSSDYEWMVLDTFFDAAAVAATEGER